MSDVPQDVLNAGSDAVRMYERLLHEGYGHRWAEMCALQQPPGLKGTDRSLMQGRYNNEQLNEMPAHQAKYMVAQAKRAGISITGKYYASGLADKRGPADPAAWIDSVHDVKAVAAARNLTVNGAVEHKGRPVPRPTGGGLSERLTRELMRDERKRHPSMKKGELREYVVSKYGRKKST